MTVLRFALLVLVLAIPLAFADIAPPMPPQINLLITENGQPAASVTGAEYICTLSDNQTQTTNFTCSGGVCTEVDPHSFNECIDFGSGHFVYGYAGSQMETGYLKFDTEYTLYNVTIDAPSGAIEDFSPVTTPSPCQLGFLGLPAILLAAFLKRR